MLASGNSNSSSLSSSQDTAYAEHGVSQAWETIREGTDLMAMECIWCIQHANQKTQCDNNNNGDDDNNGDNNNDNDDGDDGLVMKVIELFITMALNSLHQGLLHEV